ncbi:phage protein NinX family protein [Acinetobacter entericus]|uniref:DUF2591 domain-containing protein n=1 Tax=Acinetobacter entericus TaxID=2989714 RepID=A0ABT3NKK9_9GAMM|nr:phage protein NinX family protein [Acinetobacter entericus]MCW8039809.1 DUF2591 domain-containing protein [Acinetobacter entericus]
MKVSDLTPNQLPTTLAKAMRVKSTPVIDWELCGKLIEKEKISLVRSYSRWTAFYVGPRTGSREAEQVGDSAIEAVVKCFIEKKLGSEV